MVMAARRTGLTTVYSALLPPLIFYYFFFLPLVPRNLDSATLLMPATNFKNSRDMTMSTVKIVVKTKMHEIFSFIFYPLFCSNEKYWARDTSKSNHYINNQHGKLEIMKRRKQIFFFQQHKRRTREI